LAQQEIFEKRSPAAWKELKRQRGKGLEEKAFAELFFPRREASSSPFRLNLQILHQNPGSLRRTRGRGDRALDLVFQRPFSSPYSGDRGWGERAGFLGV
jgi:hypothetical protein